MRAVTVADVMTTEPMAVVPDTPFKEIVRLLAGAAISAVPVVDQRGRVVGVVSEADLLRKQEHMDLELVGPPVLGSRRQRGREWRKAVGLTAGEVMSTPVMTIGPDAFLPSATRLLTEAGVRRLFVVDALGRLVGVVSRRDLLRSFLRPDEQIRQEVEREVLAVLDGTVPAATVEDGVVTVDGPLPTTVDRRTLLDRIRRVPGVVGAFAPEVD